MVRWCPCGIEKSYEKCCGFFHLGKGYSPTAESLMRSRYTAYLLKREDYLLQTWHKSKSPKTLNLGAEKVKWLGLTILNVEGGSENDITGKVEFIAEFNRLSKTYKLHEISNFINEEMKWFYVDGEIVSD